MALVLLYYFFLFFIQGFFNELGRVVLPAKNTGRVGLCLLDMTQLF
jgi:hypothetical protein